jgi:tryptophan synthase beta chain
MHLLRRVCADLFRIFGADRGASDHHLHLLVEALLVQFNGKQVRVVAVEPTACPSLTKGKYAYDFGDTAELTPLVLMHTLGHTFIPPGIHAGGLRYHGNAPLLSLLVDQKLVEPRALHQTACLEPPCSSPRPKAYSPRRRRRTR